MSSGVVTPKIFTVTQGLQAHLAIPDGEDGAGLLGMNRTRTYEFSYEHSQGWSSEREPSGSTSEKKPAPWILRPSSSKRLAWDVCGMLFIGYDLLTIPVQLAFQPSSTDFTNAVFWLALAFWSADIVCSFCTGFYSHGAEELRPRSIARHYVSTWLVFDLFVVASDFVAWFGDEGRAPAMARMGKSLRIVRVVRSLRLLRLVKLQKLIETLMDHIDSEHFHILIGMAKGTFFVLGMNHIIACSWYGVGMLTNNGTDSWVDRANFEIESDFSYKYLTALHWSLTQFTPASMEIVPRNTHERAFAVCVLIFALLVFSSFLSSLTASMTQLRQLSWKFDKNLSLLRKYLRTHMISAGLSIRILRYVEYRLATNRQEIRESDVYLLNILSTQLNMELVQETYEPILITHPFLHQYALASRAAMRDLCNKATQRVQFSIGDVVFSERTKAEGMLFLLKGRLKYYRKRRNFTTTLDKMESYVQVGEWCSEGSMWTDWEHVGCMVAVENAEALQVHAQKFLDVTKRHQHVLQSTLYYSYHFVQWLNEESSQGELSDLHGMERATLEGLVADAFAGDLENRAPSLATLAVLQQRNSFLQRFKSQVLGLPSASESSVGDGEQVDYPEAFQSELSELEQSHLNREEHRQELVDLVQPQPQPQPQQSDKSEVQVGAEPQPKLQAGSDEAQQSSEATSLGRFGAFGGATRLSL